ncbi:MAG: EamA family transporter, partial [Pseudomonadota bacterium]
MMLLACALIAATTIVAKALGTGQAALHPFQVTFGRFAFALLALLVFAILTRPPLTRPNLPLHLTRTIFGWGGVTLMFAAVTHIPVADATA